MSEDTQNSCVNSLAKLNFSFFLSGALNFYWWFETLHLVICFACMCIDMSITACTRWSEDNREKSPSTVWVLQPRRGSSSLAASIFIHRAIHQPLLIPISFPSSDSFLSTSWLHIFHLPYITITRTFSLTFKCEQGMGFLFCLFVFVL